MASIRKRGAQRLSQSKRRQLRKRQQAGAWRARRYLGEIERQVPSAVRLFLQGLGDAFTRPTYHRFVVLLLAALLTTGNHTILNVLRTAGLLAAGHSSSYHRVLSRSPWSP